MENKVSVGSFLVRQGGAKGVVTPNARLGMGLCKYTQSVNMPSS